MKPDELRRMYELEDSYWWFVGRRRILRGWLGRMTRRLENPRPLILDVGCGTGANLDLLREFGEVLGIDSEEAAIRFCGERGLDGLTRARAQDLPFGDGTFDLVTSFEVLEHLEDDARAAGEIARVLRPGGRLLATVPAYQWLWSEHDVALDHRRRYSRRAFVALLRGAGLEVERVSHCVTVLLPVTVLFRWGQRLRDAILHRPPAQPTSGLVLLPRVVSSVFAATLAAEAALLRTGLNLPWGVTLVAQARKP
jgi:SAM-dependent methyltransferase